MTRSRPNQDGDRPDDARGGHDGAGIHSDPWRALGRPGGDWTGLSPTLDNPLTWSIDCLRVGGLTVRLHMIFLAYGAVQVIRAVPGADADASASFRPELVLSWLGCLLLVVLLHEVAHALACRFVGGTSGELMLWPLGGLTHCHAGNDPRANLLVASAGPAAMVCRVTGPMLLATTGVWWGVVLPNPLEPLAGLGVSAIMSSWPRMLLGMIHVASFLLLVANLVPMFPLDGGRAVHALLWRRMGYVQAMRQAVRIGFMLAVVMGIVAVVWGHLLMLLLASFGAFTCFVSQKQMEFTEDFMGNEGGEVDQFVQHMLDAEVASAPPIDGDGRADSRSEQASSMPASLLAAGAELQRALHQAEQAAEEQARVDRILAKISASGLGSLTPAERRVLDRASQRRRAAAEGRGAGDLGTDERS